MEEIMEEAKAFTNVSLDKDEDDDADLNDHCAHLPLGLPLGKGTNSSLTGINE